MKVKVERPLDRFPFSRIGVSYFAEQAYCEKRVELFEGDGGSLTLLNCVPGARSWWDIGVLGVALLIFIWQAVMLKRILKPTKIFPEDQSAAESGGVREDPVR